MTVRSSLADLPVRKVDSDRGSNAQFTVDRHAPPVGVDNLLHDVKPNACAADARAVSAAIIGSADV